MSFRLLLYPFAIIYGIVVFLRNKLFDLKILSSEEFDLPVISVGNITAGGTGKTPHVEYLISILKSEFNVAVLSRGYKRKTKSFLIASEDSEVKEIGDEPKQLKQKFNDILVAVDNKRVNGIRNILKTGKNIDTIILDDAYQHRWVKPGYSILLIDYGRPIFSDHLLPAGFLRESPREVKRADVVIITKSFYDVNEEIKSNFKQRLHLKPTQLLYTTKISYKNPISVFNIDFKIIELPPNEITVILITGIAHSNPLFIYLSGKYKKIIHCKFKDHHNYGGFDLKNIIRKFNEADDNKTIILTTKKDAVKFQNLKNNAELCKLPVFYIPIEIKFQDNNEEINFKNNIINYVRANIRTNKRNN